MSKKPDAAQKRKGCPRKTAHNTVKGRTRFDRFQFAETPEPAHNFKAQLLEVARALRIR